MQIKEIRGEGETKEKSLKELNKKLRGLTKCYEVVKILEYKSKYFCAYNCRYITKITIAIQKKVCD